MQEMSQNLVERAEFLLRVYDDLPDLGLGDRHKLY